jgi:hypothetical protein
MHVWSRRHRNGWLAHVRQFDEGRYRAQAKPPVDSSSRSVRQYELDDERSAKDHADNVAHPDCPDPEACAGSWIEGE